MTTLLLSSRHTEDNQALWRAAIHRGWNVERVNGIQIPELSDNHVVLYIESLYAQTIAESLGLELLQVAEDWLPSLPTAYTRRQIRFTTMAEARKLTTPAFVKPPNDKSFPAKVYSSGCELPDFVSEFAPVLIADAVQWQVEFPCFCLDQSVKAISPYWRNDRPARDDGFAATDKENADVLAFAERVLTDSRIETPKAVVLDVGRLADHTWAVVEANAAWSSGIYGCDADAALDVIQYATESQ